MSVQRECDYCGTRFFGPICPNCGYDYTGVYPEIDAADEEELRETMEVAEPEGEEIPLLAKELIYKAERAGLRIAWANHGVLIRSNEENSVAIAAIFWNRPGATRTYLQVVPGQSLRVVGSSHVARRFDEIADGREVQ